MLLVLFHYHQLVGLYLGKKNQIVFAFTLEQRV